MNKKSMFIKIFSAFLICQIITVMIIGIVFIYKTVNYSEQEISNAIIEKLKSINDINDAMTDYVNVSALKLSLDGSIDKLSEDFKNEDVEDALIHNDNLRNLYSKMKQIIDVDTEIHSVYIYFEDAGYILSSRTGIDKIDNFYDTKWIDEYHNYKNKGASAVWLRTRIPLDIEKYEYDTSLSNLNLQPEYVMSYVFPLSVYTTQIKGEIVINVFKSRFEKILNSENNINKDGYTYSINKDGYVLTNPDISLIGKDISETDYIKKIKSNTNQDGYLIQKIKGKKQLITYYKSESNGWVYIGIYPLNSLMSNTRGTLIKIIYIIILISLICIIVYYYISKKIYSPVKLIIQDIKKKSGIEVSEENNEIDILSKAFDSIIKENQNVNNLLEMNKMNIRDKYIIDIASGIKQDYKDYEIMTLGFEFQSFLCAVLCIDKYQEFLLKYKDEQQNVMKNLIIKISEEVINEQFKCVGANLSKDMVLLVINIDRIKIEKDKNIINDFFKKIKIEISKVLDNTITIGIGNIYNGIDNVKFSYYEAINTVKRRLIVGNNSIIECMIENELYNQYYYPTNIEKAIINSLDDGSEENIKKSVKEIGEYIKSKKNISYENAIFIYNQLLGKIMEYLLNNNISLSSAFEQNYNIYKHLSTKDTIDEIEEWLDRILINIIDYSEKRKNSDRKFIDKVLEYINNNYKKDIDVNTLAEDIGISYSQLRRVFINEIGMNLVNYINKLRIDEAKTLLRESDINVFDIALSIGYNNDQSFNRYFKKFEGITPSEYRNKYKFKIQ